MGNCSGPTVYGLFPHLERLTDLPGLQAIVSVMADDPA